MEFISWLLKLFPDLDVPLVTVVKSTIIISIFYGLLSNPINTLLGITMWLALMYYIYRREWEQ